MIAIGPGLRVLPLLRRGLVVACLAMGLSVGWSVNASPAHGAAYDRFYANFAGEELMRAINADRAAEGLAAYATDATLERIARDRAIACPSNKNLIIRGRARDMADRDYLSHDVQGCSTSSGTAFSSFDLLRAFDYTFTAVGETLADNDYPSSRVTYDTGCGIGGTSCHGSTSLPSTVAVAERGWMNSAGHRGILLSTGYDRFGCAAWGSSSGNKYYACYFVRGGNGLLDKSGPSIGDLSGVGATFAVGSTPTFNAMASDGASLLADGWAAIDGVHLRDWAWDHAGTSATLSAKARPLTAGSHTFTWHVRDASTRVRTRSFTFSVGSSSTPGPRAATPRPKATTKPLATGAPLPKPTPAAAGPSPAASPRSVAVTALPGGPTEPGLGPDARPTEPLPPDAGLATGPRSSRPSDLGAAVIAILATGLVASSTGLFLASPERLRRALAALIGQGRPGRR